MSYFAIVAALLRTNSGKLEIRSVWLMKMSGEAYPKSKSSNCKSILSNFKTDYLVTLYISGTTATKLVRWGIRIYSYLVAMKSAVMPNKGNRSNEIRIIPNARSTMLTAEKAVSCLNWNLAPSSNSQTASLVRLHSEMLIWSAIGLGMYCDSFWSMWVEMEPKYSVRSDDRWESEFEFRTDLPNSNPIGVVCASSECLVCRDMLAYVGPC